MMSKPCSMRFRSGSAPWIGRSPGHSEGVVSATHAGRMALSDVRRIVLASSLTSRNYQGSGLSKSDVTQLNVPILWVHHKNDPCRATPYSVARNFADDAHSPLLSIVGSKNSRGDACKPFTEHGFVGVEEKTIKRILSWIRTGQIPSDVSE